MLCLGSVCLTGRAEVVFERIKLGTRTKKNCHKRTSLRSESLVVLKEAVILYLQMIWMILLCIYNGGLVPVEDS